MTFNEIVSRIAIVKSKDGTVLRIVDVNEPESLVSVNHEVENVEFLDVNKVVRHGS